jgi:hypothetical protein
MSSNTAITEPRIAEQNISHQSEELVAIAAAVEEAQTQNAPEPAVQEEQKSEESKTKSTEKPENQYQITLKQWKADLQPYLWHEAPMEGWSTCFTDGGIAGGKSASGVYFPNNSQKNLVEIRDIKNNGAELYAILLALR